MSLEEQMSDDPEALREFRDTLESDEARVARWLACLDANPADGEALAGLFRTLHTLKGNARMVFLQPVVAFVHALEDLIADARDGVVPYDRELGQALRAALARLRELCEGLPEGGAKNGKEELEAGRIALEGLRLHRRGSTPDPFAARLAGLTKPLPRRTPEEDLVFFYTLSLRIEHLYPCFRGRTDRQLAMALEMNAMAGNPVDPKQLEAAICLRDIGMAMIPGDALRTRPELSLEQRQELNYHPEFSAGLLERMAGWEEAAEMVRQHHERPDGTGYPAHLTLERICPGARILAIVDAFEAMTAERLRAGGARPVFQAVSEINALAGRQFCPEWVAVFNHVIYERR